MDLSSLRRAPDVEAPGLQAADAADRLILDEATPFLEALSGGVGADPDAGRPTSTAHRADGAAVPDGTVSVIGDTHGALALSVASTHRVTDVRVHQDAVLGERAILANAARLGLADSIRIEAAAPALVRGARVVLLRLPRSLDALDEAAELIATHAAPDVVVIAGGRLKHMSTAMNEVLRRHFARLDVSHARQKSRVLIAREPLAERPVADGATAPRWPRTAHDDELDLDVVAHGGVFAGATVDIGTRFLLAELDAAIGEPPSGTVGQPPRSTVGAPPEGTVVDLACGTGIVAVELARRLPRARVIAADQSAAAVASATATAAANGLDGRITVVRADGLEFADEASVDLVVLNPPFHAGAAVTTALAERLFAEAGRALAPGGRLVAVWNSHLRYRPALERHVGPTRQVARNAKFTVTVSIRP